jgi:A/G-specific adenine glycosylase
MDLTAGLLEWYDTSARDLPWRRPGTTPWAVLVSEVMLQQTPVSRVMPVYDAWLARWPDASALAADSPGKAVRMWGKLGYPRRALRLHECADGVVARFAGQLPRDVDDLLSLPGVGAYTARAVAAFAFGQRQPVVDTNVRRVVSRAVRGAADAPPAPARDHAVVEALLPADPASAVGMSVALMELGALVCTARAPSCDRCPISAACAWRAAGYPRSDGRTVAPQRFAGTDRQVRGLLLDVLRSSEAAVTRSQLDLVWAEHVQRNRALASLLTDGLVHELPDGTYALPA